MGDDSPVCGEKIEHDSLSGLDLLQVATVKTVLYKTPNSLYHVKVTANLITPLNVSCLKRTHD